MNFSLISNHIYRVNMDNRAPSFCFCNYPRFDVTLVKQIQQISSICNCGEDAEHHNEWQWDEKLSSTQTYVNGKSIIFHPIYSQGTSVIRGERPLTSQKHHYFEIKINTCLSGTDIMIGVGTDKLDLTSHQYRFSSVLGLDNQSWGYSYRGVIQNQGVLKYYGKKFSRGCIVGVHVDLIRGTLEYYLNRIPQGIAYRNITISQNVDIYPMACSTSAKSSIKLINSTSYDETLQLMCMKTISRDPRLLKEINRMPGLKNLTKQFWFLQSNDGINGSGGGDNKQRYGGEFEQNNLLLEDEAILCGHNKNSNKKIRTDYEDNDKDGNGDIGGGGDDDDSDNSRNSSGGSSNGIIYHAYHGMHKIKHKHTKLKSNESSDDDDGVYSSFFCDH